MTTGRNETTDVNSNSIGSKMSKPNKRKKNFYVQCTKKPRHNILTTGIRGFLVSCNLTQSYQEKRCVMEAYNILNEYADKLHGPEMSRGGEMSLDEELQDLRDQGKFEPRRFLQLYTSVPNCLFIQTQLPNPCSLMSSILEDLEKSQQQKTRYLLRMFPILLTCKPYLEDMQKGIVKTIETFFELSEEYRDKENVSYMILFKARNNHMLQKDSVVKYLNDAIRGMEKQRLEPELRNPDLVLSIDVLQLVCCLSVMPNYFRFRKYNLVELTKGPKISSKASDPVGQTEASGKDIDVADAEKPAAQTTDANGKDIAADAEKVTVKVEPSEDAQGLGEDQVASKSNAGVDIDAAQGSHEIKEEALEETEEMKDLQGDSTKE